MSKNITPEFYDDGVAEEGSKEDILMNESDILQGLLDLEKEKDNPENYHKIQIKRNGAVKLEFRVRPLSEDESRVCMKRATPTPKDKNVRPEANGVKYRSLLIYSATVNEDRAKTWDNPKAKAAMNLMEGWEMIDKVIFAGEKSRVIDIIEEISGFGVEETEAEEEAKN